MKYISNSLATLVVGILPFQATAQLEEADPEEAAYYMFPIKPGQRNYLAGTMGELRSSHFHTGIDIRTEGRTGLPVYAAADGYISRAVISTYGYGNALYILHPNGHTTAYAHLEGFTDNIAEYMRKQQYKRQAFHIDRPVPKTLFPVKKGDIIAYSGNSGSSGGPHLHFDIRDKYQQPLNPLAFGFDEIVDTTPPVAASVLLRTLDINSRVEGTFGQKKFPLRRTGNNYSLETPVRASGQVGILLDAHDKLDNSRFRCGINKIEVRVNDMLTFSQNIESLSFSRQKEIFRHMSYEDLQLSGKRYHKLYVDDGNKLTFYQADRHSGKLLLKNGEQYAVKILMTDTYGNSATIAFEITGSEERDTAGSPMSSMASDFIMDNTLIIKTKKKDTGAIVFNGTAVLPAYGSDHANTFLIDLRKELPKVAEIDSTFKKYDYKDRIAPGKSYTYYDPKVKIYFQQTSLFDTLYLKTGYTYNTTTKAEIWEIGSPITPLRKPVKISLIPNKQYDRSKFRVYKLDDNDSRVFEGGEWEGDVLAFSTRSFARYTIAADSVPPSIVPVKINKNDLVFKISDDHSGIESFNAYVNDQWVLMNYDHKRSLIWSEKLDNSIPFKGAFKLIVTDMVNNEKIYSSTLK